METCLPDWNDEVGVDFPLPNHRKPLGLAENELVELVWQNGEVVLNNQTNNRKQPKQAHNKHRDDQSNPNNSIQDFETISWIDCPIDDTFGKEFYSNLLAEIPAPNPVEPPQIFDQNLSSVTKTDNNFKSTGKKQACSVRTINSSHCASNQVANDADMSWASSSYGIGSKAVSAGVELKYGRNVGPQHESTTDKAETLGHAVTSCSGGSGSSSFWNISNETNSHNKRKVRDVEESECRSDATELEAASGNKKSQKSGTTRRRVAEIHNLSERRRRDRINERMRALQELIPHSNKSDKASMLDEAIEYMKSLQLQLQQMMWMGNGMAPMMLPGMQHYMSRFGMGMGMGAQMLPAIQNLMRLSRMPHGDQTINMAPRMNQALINYQNQMQISGFPEQYANYMGFHSMPNASQAMNMFNFGFQSAQQNVALTPPDNGNGSNGRGS